MCRMAQYATRMPLGARPPLATRPLPNSAPVSAGRGAPGTRPARRSKPDTLPAEARRRKGDGHVRKREWDTVNVGRGREWSGIDTKIGDSGCAQLPQRRFGTSRDKGKTVRSARGLLAATTPLRSRCCTARDDSDGHDDSNGHDDSDGHHDDGPLSMAIDIVTSLRNLCRVRLRRYVTVALLAQNNDK
jgi:hypothetical protein